jgi:hypothetical protein
MNILTYIKPKVKHEYGNLKIREAVEVKKSPSKK